MPTHMSGLAGLVMIIVAGLFPDPWAAPFSRDAIAIMGTLLTAGASIESVIKKGRP